MKKGITLFVVAVLSVGLLSACSGKKDQNMNDQNMPGMDHSKMQNGQ